LGNISRRNLSGVAPCTTPIRDMRTFFLSKWTRNGDSADRASADTADAKFLARSQDVVVRWAIIVGLPENSNVLQGLLAQLVEQRTLNP
jgi:hypothetical protein